MSRFQPGIAAMYACTGASPSAFATRGLPPERRTAALAPAFGWDLDLVAGLRALLARDVPLAFGFALFMGPVQSVRRPLRHLVAYGSTNK
jgi:hypothetical protein